MAEKVSWRADFCAMSYTHRSPGCVELWCETSRRAPMCAKGEGFPAKLFRPARQFYFAAAARGAIGEVGVDAAVFVDCRR